MSREKSRLNITVDREVKRRAKKASKQRSKTLSAICENALKRFIELEEFKCGGCGAVYSEKVLEKIDQCQVCKKNVETSIGR